MSHWYYICDVSPAALQPLLHWVEFATDREYWSVVGPTKPSRIHTMPAEIVTPIIAEVLSEYVVPVRGDSPMLSRMLPGQSHPYHTDVQRADCITRVHVPITTNPGCWMMFEDEEEVIEVAAWRGDLADLHNKSKPPLKDETGKQIGEFVSAKFVEPFTMATFRKWKRVHFEVGRAYSFDTLARHSFGNDGEDARVHLIFEVLRS